MLLPGSKGWINKYFSLVESGEIDLSINKIKSISNRHQLHLLSGKSGIVFGHSNRFIFFDRGDSIKWTEEEKVKFLQFETLLLAYILKNGVSDTLKFDFISSMLSFYANQKTKSIQSILTFWVKEGKTAQLENILSKRVDISKGIFDNRWWFRTMSNVFIYLDVILYNKFLEDANEDSHSNYNSYAYNSLIVILLAANADGKMDKKELAMFNAFMSSANLEGDLKEKAVYHFKNGVDFLDFFEFPKDDKLFCRYLIDMSFLTLLGNEDIRQTELDHVYKLAEFLDLSVEDVEESMTIVENFLLYSDSKYSFLTNKSSYERVYGSFTARWTKVILRNKDKLAVELSQSKELVSLIKKSATNELTNEEKDKVKTQFLDLVKSVPALAIFMLPGGAILLPIILKLLPTLIPSAFRDNE